jgi:hypothetical protein
MSMALDRRCLTVLLAMPVAHALLVWMGVAACGWPIYSSAIRRGAQSRAFWNTAPSSASVADAMMFRIMELMVWMEPLYGGGVAVGLGVADGSGGLELRKKLPPAWLLDLASKRYEASLWMWRYMSLAVYGTVASGWAAAYLRSCVMA